MALPLVKTWPNLWVIRWSWLRSLLDLQFASIRQALAAFPRTPRRLVLDFGAGTSPWKNVLPPHQMLLTVDSGGGADYLSLEEIDPSLRFDLILLAEVLEHVAEPEELLRTLKKRLSPTGELWITVPLLAREHPAPDDFGRWTRQGLRRLFDRAGLETLEIRARGTDIAALAHQFNYVTFRSWLSPSTWILGLILLHALPFWWIVGALALRFDWGRDDGPLGYAARAR